MYTQIILDLHPIFENYRLFKYNPYLLILIIDFEVSKKVALWGKSVYQEIFFYL